MPSGARPAAHEVHSLNQTSSRSENQRPGKVRGGLCQDARRVGDDHLPHLRRDHVDVVVADCDIGHDSEIGKVLEFGSAHPTREQWNDGDPVALWCGLVSIEPSDVEVRELCWLKEILKLGGDQNRMTHDWITRVNSRLGICRSTDVRRLCCMCRAAASSRSIKHRKATTTSTSCAAVSLKGSRTSRQRESSGSHVLRLWSNQVVF